MEDGGCKGCYLSGGTHRLFSVKYLFDLFGEAKMAQNFPLLESG